VALGAQVPLEAPRSSKGPLELLVFPGSSWAPKKNVENTWSWNPWKLNVSGGKYLPVRLNVLNSSSLSSPSLAWPWTGYKIRKFSELPWAPSDQEEDPGGSQG
jgi:hypothetical protein